MHPSSGDLKQDFESLMDPDNPLVSNLANAASLLYWKLGKNVLWAGFYIYQQDKLILGPFHGPVACTSIQPGRGVCGKSFSTKTTIVVPNVDEFPDHIACSPLSKSEIVVPIIVDNVAVGVLDIDATELNAFDQSDALLLEDLVQIIASCWKSLK
jgi:L-methionine (R)-S-oxide reductase